MLKVLDKGAETEVPTEQPTLDELAREGARRMLMAALRVEVAQYVDAQAEARDDAGRRLVVRNGQAVGERLSVEGALISSIVSDAECRAAMPWR